MVNLETSTNNSSSGSADLLGLGLAGGTGGSEESPPSVNGNGFSQEPPTNNLSKYVIIRLLPQPNLAIGNG